MRKGWLTNDRLSHALHFIVHGGEPLVLDTSDFRWVNVTLHGDGGVDGVFCEPTDSGLAEVSCDLNSHRVRKIHVRALCSEWQQEAISDVLLTYARLMRKRMPVGNDRVCLHDTAFEPTHDGNCTLVAWHQFAAALQVEVEALLAEPQPDPET